MTQVSTSRPSIGVKGLDSQRNSSGEASINAVSQTNVSLSTTDLQLSTRPELHDLSEVSDDGEEVAAWKRPIPKTQRVKEDKPRDVTCKSI